MSFGEHKDEDFLEADMVVYSAAINPNLPQLELASKNGKEVYSDFALAYKLCKKPVVAVCGSYGRTTIAAMIGYTLKIDGKNVFVGGTSDAPFIDYCLLPNMNEIDYVVVEVSASSDEVPFSFVPKLWFSLILVRIFLKLTFLRSVNIWKRSFLLLRNYIPEDTLIANYDTLANNASIRNANCQVYWYSRRSYVTLGVMNEIQGTHFHDRRIHSNINYHSEFIVSKMRIVGQVNRENLIGSSYCL